MKYKLIIILLLIIPIYLNAQIDKTTNIFGKDIQNDKINHFTISFMASAFTTAITNKWLSENTDLSPFWCKFISGNAGFWTTIGIGYVWEMNNGVFNPYDMEANIIGAGVGVLTIEAVLFRSISEKQLRKKELVKKLENN